MKNTRISQISQSAKLNKSAAQRRYRKKEGQGFLQLRQALKEVSKDDPRSKQDTLKRDENLLLLQQKALIEVWNNGREFYRNDHPRPPPDDDPLFGMQWWSHDTAKMADITRSHTARHDVPAASVSPDVNMFAAPDSAESTKTGIFLCAVELVIPRETASGQYTVKTLDESR
ncbi:hypothetical protein K503DRAFT_782503 [Rhizopogon vinicolor AM-OR11-026]|uniref:Uncharacterized protein n=1 Tax=Rhizopogon vinicolor AM-OR11-026 TaxID=1314800 RepID=A0A1B7N271_9AGAM|nr:hypothetical protein K503DRAFT_782503 [Rhizopogon vinicolor AM-OR11-026]